MNKKKIETILNKLYSQKLTPEEALKEFTHMPYENIGFANIDHHRSMRQGFPEVIFCEGKTEEQNIEIIKRMRDKGSDILATRSNESLYKKIKKFEKKAEFNKEARTIVIISKDSPKKGKIIVTSAGTSDIPVSEEAAVTAETMGSKVERLYDVGVAGIHRIINNISLLTSARVIVVAAGMDGALPSVIGGLVDKPVIAIPTSIGYGASFKGISALLAMLNSCAPGVGVVNIDNGFGAGCLAHKINMIGENS
jgi:NCAIR mutase (PurE)-related protein